MNWRRLLLPLFVRKMSHSVSALSAASSLGAGRDLGKNLRVELFFSSADELTQRVAFLKSKGVVSYNLVNKSNGDDLLSSVKIIQKQFDSSDQCSVNAHYSLKYNKSRKMDGQANLLKDFIAEMNHYGKQNE